MSIKSLVKALLSDSNDSGYSEVLVGGNLVWLSNHDQTHVHISLLPPINMAGNLVNGINGVPIREFGREGCESLYSPYLDECRVGIHQWCVSKTPCTWVRLAYWAYWMLKQKMNPVNVITQHIQSMQ